MEKSKSLPIVKNNKIKSLVNKKDFELLREFGSFIRLGEVNCVVRPNGSDSCRVAFSISKKKAISVHRSFVKRYLKEELRQSYTSKLNFDLLFILKTNVKKLNKTERSNLAVSLRKDISRLTGKFETNFGIK